MKRGGCALGVNFLRASSELPNTCDLFLYAKSL
uniref:Uncharacterized protein n=1 Tax=Siphoviridae sp. ctuOq1 TaxID=2825713 RepID=A0A8S5UZ56_9CAUD|nr:MAG TPA: hypothetical protein [Siphoviridae sp. ctuOq1]